MERNKRDIKGNEDESNKEKIRNTEKNWKQESKDYNKKGGRRERKRKTGWNIKQKERSFPAARHYGTVAKTSAILSSVFRDLPCFFRELMTESDQHS
jgi:hypothetical protein